MHEVSDFTSDVDEVNNMSKLVFKFGFVNLYPYFKYVVTFWRLAAAQLESLYALMDNHRKRRFHAYGSLYKSKRPNFFMLKSIRSKMYRLSAVAITDLIFNCAELKTADRIFDFVSSCFQA